MKTYILKFNILSALIILMASCNNVVTYNEDYNDGLKSFGPPIINSVYYVDDTGFEKPITEANFGEYLMLKGENLSNVKSILMNDVEVDMNNVYATASSAWLAVPSTAPNEITNKIYYITELGETQYDFTVIVPDVSVLGLYNEMAPAGTDVKLIGSYFALHGFGTKETSKVSMNGNILEISEINDESITIHIPEDSQPNSVIDVEWVGVDGYKKVSVPYAQKECLICEDWSASGNWGDPSFLVTEPTGDAPIALCGPYFRVKKSFAAWAFCWVVGASLDLSPEMSANPGDYLFKFEVNSNLNNPFQDTGENDGNGYAITLGSDSNKFEWNPSANQSFNTYGEWCTVRLELSDLLSQEVPASGNITFKISFQPIDAIDADHSFANFRIVKK